MNCDKFQQFSVGCERRFDPAARRSWGAVLCSTVDTYSASARGDFWNNFWLFYVNGYTRLLTLPLVLLFFFMAAHVVDHGSGMFFPGFPGDDAPRAVFPTFARNGEVCTVGASAEYFSLKTWTLFLRPLVLQYFQLCADSAGDFLGVLDDEEFFVVEGDFQVTCHRSVSVTHCGVDVM